MDLSNLKPAEGSVKKKKRIARGIGSGKGRTATRGHKGQKSRSGYSRRFGFETLKTLFQAFGTEIIVINGEIQKEPREELIEDLITIISHFAGKLYGMRSHKYKEVVKNAKQLFKE